MITYLRWMIRRDLPRVLSIENQIFDDAWTCEDFFRLMSHTNCRTMVTVCDEEIVGYMVYQLHISRIHLLNFAVAPKCQDIGIGTQMMQNLMSKLSNERRDRIMLEVRETNLKAQLFFRGAGFVWVETLRDFYTDCDEDAYLMQFRLSEPTEIINRKLDRAYQYDTKQEWK